MQAEMCEPTISKGTENQSKGDYVKARTNDAVVKTPCTSIKSLAIKMLTPTQIKQLKIIIKQPRSLQDYVLI